jgi:hypothetical protein
MSDVSSVTSHFSTANEGFATTLASPITAGAVTVPLTSITGLTNGSIFVGIIEPGGTKQQVFTGTVSTGSTSITGVKWTRGTNADHSAGVSIVDYVTGTDHNMMTKGILVQHNQDGSHSNITATAATIASGLTVTAGAVSLPTASLNRTAVNWSSFANNMKSATNASTINIVGNAGYWDLGGFGPTLSFTVAANCNAFVTVSTGLNSISDIEHHPVIYRDGSIFFDFNPNATLGSASGRASVRSFTYVVPLTAGTHTLSVGIFTMNGGACAINPNAATIAALVLGNVTA